MEPGHRRMAIVVTLIVVAVTVGAVAYMRGDGRGVPPPNDQAAGDLGNFTDASGGLPQTGDYFSVVLADLDGDGHDDLVASAGQNGGTVDTHGIHAYLYDGSGGWKEASDGLPTTTYTFGGVAVADLDGDGRPDIVAPTEGWSGSGDLGVTVHLNRLSASGGISWVDGPVPVGSGYYHQAIVTDLNGDGLADIAAAGRDDGVRAWLGGRGQAGALTWTEASAGLPSRGQWISVAAADLDGDGKVDIAATPYSSASPEVRIYIGDGTGRWTARSGAMPRTSHIPIMVAIADVNADSRPDLVVSLRDDGLACFLGSGLGDALTFTAASAGLPTRGGCYQVAIGDLDMDGHLDILAACIDRGLELYLGGIAPAGGWEWSRVGLHLPEGSYSGAALGDIDGDGVLDVAGGQWGTSSEGGLQALLGHMNRE